MSRELPFDPYPYFDCPHRQTVLNGAWTWFKEPPSKQKLVQMSDGDLISLEITTPEGWRPTDPSVMIMHGLCGSHRSSNLVRMTHRLTSYGIRVIRFNMRGCGSGKGLARQSYHSGRSEDVFEALKVLKSEHPDSPTLLIGFSLGGNIVLKLTGELGSLGKVFIEGTIAICPPVDLYSSILLLGSSGSNMYERYFYKLLRAEVHYRHNKFKELPPIRLPRNMKLYEFDQMYTAPFNGFQSAHDYYDKCSSKPLIPNIEVPCKILLSQDDPIISSTSLDNVDLPSNIELYKTKKGGHMGYLGDTTKPQGFYWLDSVLTDWIREILIPK